jgi:transglutaminase-like putative cysteine protease
MLTGFSLAVMTKLSNQHFKFLLAIFGFILALHVSNLPIWITIVCMLFGAWRLGILYGKLKAPTLTVLAPLTLLIGLGILFTFSGQINKASGLSMLVAMLALKLLETKTKRDVVIVIIAHYLVVGYLFLFNQSLIIFLASLIATLLLTSALIQTNLKNSMHYTNLMGLSGKLLLQAMPIMLLLFILFPRSTGPLWGGIQQGNPKIGLPGLSGAIELNQMSQNAQDSSVAFRVQFSESFPPTQDLYWRGPVLWTVIGDRWQVAEQYSRLSQEQMIPSGKPYAYTVTLEPNHHHWLLMLDMPTQAPAQGSLSKDYSVISNTNTRDRTVYKGISYTNYLLAPASRLPRRTLRMALQIDEDANPRTIALAREWSHLSTPTIIENALMYYKNNGFIYTLNPPNVRNDVIDHFLFQSKSGFCEHFATSFVYMLRAAGVPARVVTGYQGGEKNNDYLIIRQSDAHAWAEVWIETIGWIRVDPTAIVSPERVQVGIADAIEKSKQNQPTSTTAKSSNNQLPIALRSKQYPALHSAILAWDRIEYRWNKSVVSYNRNNQQSLLSKLTKQPIKPVQMWIALVISILLACAFAVFIMFQKNRAKLNKTQKLYFSFLNMLKPYHLTPATSETAVDFAMRVSEQFPHQKENLMAIAHLYNYLMYGRFSGVDQSAQHQQFKQMIEQFSSTYQSKKS